MPTGDRGGKNVPVVLVVCHAGNQWPMSRHPRIAIVRKQFALKIGSELGRPSQLRFQRADRFRHNLRRPSRLAERRGLGKPEQRVAQREVGKNAGVKNYQRAGAHS